MGNSESGCCGPKPKNQGFKEEYISPITGFRNSEEYTTLSNSIKEHLVIDQLFCQQIYDIFRDKILQLKIDGSSN